MTVIVRDWDDLAAEFGIRPTGTIACPYGFNDHVMKDTCGKMATVVGIHQPGAFALIFNGEMVPEVDSYHPSTFRPSSWEDLISAKKKNQNKKIILNKILKQ